MSREFSGSHHCRQEDRAVPAQVDVFLETQPKKKGFYREKAPEILGYYGAPLLGGVASIVTENPSPGVMAAILLGKDAVDLTRELINHRRETKASKKAIKGIQLEKKGNNQG